jgi:hypothetical protein
MAYKADYASKYRPIIYLSPKKIAKGLFFLLDKLKQ